MHYFTWKLELHSNIGCLCSSTHGRYPCPSALGPHLVGPRSQNIARLNTTLLFNFEIVITLKLETKFFFCFCFNYKWCKKQKIIKQWSFIKKYKIMIVCKKTDKWYIAWNRLTTSDNEWQRVVQWMTNSDNKWPRVVQRTTTSDTTSDSE